jgi:protocatechuate 4,5-dioxygenase alpha chain
VSVYEISRLLYSLREPENRQVCRANPETYYRRYDLEEAELQLLLKPDWQGLVDAGVSIYLLTKLGATLDVDLLEIGASMRGLTRDEFLGFVKAQAGRNRKYAVLLE